MELLKIILAAVIEAALCFIKKERFLEFRRRYEKDLDDRIDSVSGVPVVRETTVDSQGSSTVSGEGEATKLL